MPVRTYIEGFDDAIGGGIPEGHSVLVSGTPGTMKSSICLNILYNNHKQDDKKGLYISLEETKESLQRSMERLGIGEFDENEVFIVDMGKLRLEYKEMDQSHSWLKIVTDYVERRVRDEGFEIVVLDSLTALYSLVEFDNPRQELFHFFGFLRQLGVTTFFISEMIPGSDRYGPYREDFLTDGNLLLRLYDVGETDIQLRIRCVKLRHCAHHRGYFALLHRGNRFMVTPVISE